MCTFSSMFSRYTWMAPIDSDAVRIWIDDATEDLIKDAEGRCSLMADDILQSSRTLGLISSVVFRPIMIMISYQVHSLKLTAWRLLECFSYGRHDIGCCFPSTPQTLCRLNLIVFDYHVDVRRAFYASTLNPRIDHRWLLVQMFALHFLRCNWTDFLNEYPSWVYSLDSCGLIVFCLLSKAFVVWLVSIVWPAFEKVFTNECIDVNSKLRCHSQQQGHPLPKDRSGRYLQSKKTGHLINPPAYARGTSSSVSPKHTRTGSTSHCVQSNNQNLFQQSFQVIGHW